MTELSERMTALRARGNLTYSDLRLWFDRPYPTVRAWAVGFSQPFKGAELEAVLDRLAVLERLVRIDAFPIPTNLGLQAHAQYFRQIKDAYGARVSGGNSPEGRA